MSLGFQYMAYRDGGIFQDLFGDDFGWWCAGALFVIPLFKSILEGLYFQQMFRIGIHLKSSLVSGNTKKLHGISATL